MKINRKGDETIIESHLIASCSDMECVIKKSGGDNGDAGFSLKIQEKGQVSNGCYLEMCGPIERSDFLPFLKQIVYEIELLDK